METAQSLERLQPKHEDLGLDPERHLDTQGEVVHIWSSSTAGARGLSHVGFWNSLASQSTKSHSREKVCLKI